MTDPLVREIAEQIIRDGLVENWRFYALVSGVGVLSAVLGNLAGAYMKKRGETLATQTDMRQILKQLEATTHATEQVRISLSHADWIAREWRTIRRTKLEDLMISVYQLDKWLEEEQAKWVYQKPLATEIFPMNHIRILCTLYFPELRIEAEELHRAHNGARELLLEIAPKTTAANAALDATAYQAAVSEFLEGWKRVYPPAHNSLLKFETKAAEVMQTLADA